jgi:hypothetical protein
MYSETASPLSTLYPDRQPSLARSPLFACYLSLSAIISGSIGSKLHLATCRSIRSLPPAARSSRCAWTDPIISAYRMQIDSSLSEMSDLAGGELDMPRVDRRRGDWMGMMMIVIAICPSHFTYHTLHPPSADTTIHPSSS